jgi:hypothetical protein
MALAEYSSVVTLIPKAELVTEIDLSYMQEHYEVWFVLLSAVPA